MPIAIMIRRGLASEQKIFDSKRSEIDLLQLATAGFNFINILRKAFMHADPKSAKKYSQAINLF